MSPWTTATRLAATGLAGGPNVRVCGMAIADDTFGRLRLQQRGSPVYVKAQMATSPDPTHCESQQKESIDG
jgi:hypothetical protein